jgi:hypothetical protein
MISVLDEVCLAGFQGLSCFRHLRDICSRFRIVLLFVGFCRVNYGSIVGGTTKLGFLG